jgi:hypothetical protein
MVIQKTRGNDIRHHQEGKMGIKEVDRHLLYSSRTIITTWGKLILILIFQNKTENNFSQ